MKKAMITGVTGQDGSYLSEFLIEKGYDVHGIIRRNSVDYRERIAHLEGHSQFHLHYGDLSDTSSLVKVIDMVRPDEIYNLAAQSHVQVSFDSPEFTADIDAIGVLRVLEAVRITRLTKTCRIYQASTSELYGKVEEVPQSETTPFHPYSPYAIAKQYGFWITKEYREAYNMFCCSGILFNHESERRGETFVTRKITLAAARIAQGSRISCISAISHLFVIGGMQRTMWSVCGLFFSTISQKILLSLQEFSILFVSSLHSLSIMLELNWNGLVKVWKRRALSREQDVFLLKYLLTSIVLLML